MLFILFLNKIICKLKMRFFKILNVVKFFIFNLIFRLDLDNLRLVFFFNLGEIFHR